MQIDIKYQPSYSLAIVSLAAGESIQAESGAMVSMSSNIQVDTTMKGGVLGAVARKFLGGESLFANTFTAAAAPGEITLAPSLPGDLTTVKLTGQTLFIQSGSFLAGDPAVELDLSWGGARGFFGGEGLFLLRATGTGTVVLSSYGAIHRVEVSPASPYVCDTGHVVAFGEGLQYDVRKVGGWKSTLLSGEGLVCEFRGSGSLWMQTRSTQAFLSWLLPRLPTGTGGGGRGSTGIFGNILRGE